MAQAAANAMAMLGLDPVTVAQLAAANPAAFLGLSQERGALAVGLRADWVQLSTAMAPVATSQRLEPVSSHRVSGHRAASGTSA